MDSQLLKYCLEQKQQGRSNSELKTELEKKGFSKDEVLEIVKRVDDEYLNSLLQNQPKTFQFNLNGLATASFIILGVSVIILLILGIVPSFLLLFLAGILIISIINRHSLKSRRELSERKRNFRRGFSKWYEEDKETNN